MNKQTNKHIPEERRRSQMIEPAVNVEGHLLEKY